MKILLILMLFTTTCFGNPKLKPIFEQVSQEYSVSYELLSKIADLESSFNPNAKAKTSSAKGLYQIISNTESWLRDICDISGDIFDPLTNTRLGACYLQFNQNYLKKRLDRTPTDLECYIAHFLGGRNALKLILMGQGEYAAKRFKRESDANPNVFFKKNGNMRTVGEIMVFFGIKLEKGRVL